jgi:hypothetical protein
MPRPCSVCSSHQREAIEAALVESVPYRQAAERFGTSTSALARHARHIETRSADSGTETEQPTPEVGEVPDHSGRSDNRQGLGTDWFRSRKPQPHDVAFLGPGGVGTPGLYRIDRVEFDEHGQPAAYNLAELSNGHLGPSHNRFDADRIVAVFSSILNPQE